MSINSQSTHRARQTLFLDYHRRLLYGPLMVAKGGDTFVFCPHGRQSPGLTEALLGTFGQT